MPGGVGWQRTRIAIRRSGESVSVCRLPRTPQGHGWSASLRQEWGSTAGGPVLSGDTLFEGSDSGGVSVERLALWLREPVMVSG